MPIEARKITRELRQLLPQVKPLTTRTQLSGEGMFLAWEVTLPQTAARHISAGRMDETEWLNNYLTRNLGTAVHVADMWGTRRWDGSMLTHLVLKTGAGA